MIRKSIIIVLTLAALGTGLVAVVSYNEGSLIWESSATDSRSGFSLGWFYVELNRVLASRQPESNTEWSWSTRGPAEHVNGINGFYYGRAVVNWHNGTSMLKTAVLLPLAPFVLFFAAYPTIAFIRGPLRRWRRRRKGLCLKCAYDLTGNVSGVCPECGGEVV